MRGGLLRGLAATISLGTVSVVAVGGIAADGAYDWRDDWAVLPGFAVAVDSSGYQLPTAIAFVPEPGPRPDDPLYYVAELGGQILVVTNDRTVERFAELDVAEPSRPYPAIEGESGLAGLCVDGPRGRLYATFAYQDEDAILRNAITRFETGEPGRLAVRPKGRAELRELFAPFAAVTSHQIGGCQVDDHGQVFVGVGDGASPVASQDPRQLLGKVVCIAADGGPCAEHPFGDGRDDPASYVWALGFRNPFGIHLRDENLFVAEDGGDIDRFIAVERGGSYNWDGSDASLALDADIVFTPTIAPVQLDRHPADATIFPPEHRDSFFLAASPDVGKVGVVTWEWADSEGRAVTVPTFFFKWRGPPKEQGIVRQKIVGLAFGPDGLYLVPILPDRTGRSVVLRITYDAEASYPHRVGGELGGSAGFDLITERGCLSCHQLDGRGGFVGPPLDREQLLARLGLRLNTPGYRERLARLDEVEEEPFLSTDDDRARVRATRGHEQAQHWVESKLLSPRFDDPTAQMPDLGLTAAEAQLIRDYLLRPTAGRTWSDRLGDNLKPLAVGAAGGAGLVAAGILVWHLARRART